MLWRHSVVTRAPDRPSLTAFTVTYLPPGLDIIGHQGFRPEGDPDFRDVAGREKPAQPGSREQPQLLNLALREVPAEQGIVLPPPPARQELDEWQVVVAFERLPVIGSGHETAFADAHDFSGKCFLSAIAQGVFDDDV